MMAGKAYLAMRKKMAGGGKGYGNSPMPPVAARKATGNPAMVRRPMARKLAKRRGY